MRDKLIVVAKASIYFSLAIFLLVCSYLAYIHPSLNHAVSDKLKTDKAKSEASLQDLRLKKAENSKKWTFNFTSDIGVSDERYPLVLLRYGYKVIGFSGDDAVVGWKADVVNTSLVHNYTASFEVALLDRDGFKLGDILAQKLIFSGRIESVTGTLHIPASDVVRLDDSDWVVGLDKSWDDLEPKAVKSRYERMVDVLNNEKPLWTLYITAEIRDIDIDILADIVEIEKGKFFSARMLMDSEKWNFVMYGRYDPSSSGDKKIDFSDAVNPS